MKAGLLREFFSPQIDEVDAALGAYLNERSHPADHYSIIRYHFGFSEDGKRLASGKRMRAIFCLLIGRATGARAEPLRTLMMATELMHGASLVHDDLEDADPIRWGRATVWSKFGVNQAVNAGDAMIGMVYELLLRLARDDVPGAAVVRLLHIFNQTHLRMTEGQHLDLASEGRPDTAIETYLDIIARKTASACECPSRASAVLTNCSRDLEEAYASFGRAFGMLYQIVDDVVGTWGDPDTTGKVALADIALRKASLPVLYGYHLGSPRLRGLLAHARQQRSRDATFDPNEAIEIREELAARGVRERCQEHIVQHRDEALAGLRGTGSTSPEVKMLETMTLLCAEMGGVAPE